MKNFLLCSSLAFAMAAPALDARAQNPPLTTVQLLAGKHAILAEVAATENQRELGLMYRDSMTINGGMLFVFGAPCAGNEPGLVSAAQYQAGHGDHQPATAKIDSISRR